MNFIYTDGCNSDFITLCRLLDDWLNKRMGLEQTQYNQYNALHDIHDVILVYENDEPIGCASFKFHQTGVAEVKRVFVKNEYRNKGIAANLMNVIEDNAKQKQVYELLLETGKPLIEAISLYKKIGYSVIDNFGPYTNMPNSVCMRKLL